MSSVRNSFFKKMLESLFFKLNKNKTRVDLKKIREAFLFAKEAHEGQKRESGDPYFIHPLKTAEILIEENIIDTDVICAALLHDVPEDTKFTLEDIQKKFGETIAKLVDGVTRLRKFRLNQETEEQAEALRKLFLASAADPRIILIRMADRLHNMRTLSALSKPRQQRIAKETLEIFAPLAERLGMGKMKSELEDLAFKYYLPKEYREISRQVNLNRAKGNEYIERVKEILKQELEKAKIEAEISGRIKHLYSIYQKIIKRNFNLTDIHDLIGLRIIVKTIPECYAVLGVVHKLWKPIPSGIKDYIAMPKANGYQSLHTTVFCLDNQLVEIQIRTQEMHREAEYGIAAHWYYAKDKQSKPIPKDQISWLKEIAEWQKEIKSPGEFAESLKKDVFRDRIFVLTPKGDVKDLPVDSTPIDFAYAIHTEVGHRCIGAKVFGEIVPLDYKLKNGDVVEIITSSDLLKGPSRDWLSFVKTNLAKSKIRSWFRRQNYNENLAEGKKLLDKELERLVGRKTDSLEEKRISNLLNQISYKNFNDVLVAIGEGSLSPISVVRKLFSLNELLPVQTVLKIPSKNPSVIIEGQKGLLTKIGLCCQPKPGDQIIGYVTKGKGVTIHKTTCRNIKHYSSARQVKASWEEEEKRFLVPIKIVAEDRIGLFRDIGAVASSYHINLIDLNSTLSQDGKIITLKATFQVSDPESLSAALEKIEKISNVKEVKRV